MSHVITHFNSCPEYSKMSLMQTSKWLDKTLCICNLHIRGCGKANTLMSACWLQFLTVKQKNDHVFSRWQKTVTWGIRPISQRPATSAKVRQSSRHPSSISQTVTVGWRQMWGSSKTNKNCQKHNSFVLTIKIYSCSCSAKIKIKSNSS